MDLGSYQKGKTLCRLHGSVPASVALTALRVKQIAANLKATVIIQHNPRDIGKLPAFPAAAK